MSGTLGFFVTGTDTGIGKTRSMVVLMEALKGRGFKVSGMKPVGSGCYIEHGELINNDAFLLAKHASINIPYRTVNPYALESPTSPHIAAEQAGIEVSFETILDAFNALQKQSDIVLVEGVGGWEVPLNSEQTIAELALALGLPVILVVGLRLGCLNHALLTYRAIIQTGLTCSGWIGNRVDSGFEFIEEYLQTLEQKIDAPMLGSLPYCPEFSPCEDVNYLNSSFFEQIE